MPLKGRTPEKGISFMYPGIQKISCQKELKSVDLSMDYIYHLVIHKMLLTIGIKADPYKKIH